VTHFKVLKVSYVDKVRGLWSAQASNLPQKYWTLYEPNKPTVPVPGTFLYVFDDLDIAKLFIHAEDHGLFELWECEADIADTKVLRCSPLVADDFWEIYNSPDRLIQGFDGMCQKLIMPSNSFWNSKVVECHLDVQRFSAHTRFAKSVTITKQIR
jgi:hypothetical protein